MLIIFHKKTFWCLTTVLPSLAVTQITFGFSNFVANLISKANFSSSLAFLVCKFLLPFCSNQCWSCVNVNMKCVKIYFRDIWFYAWKWSDAQVASYIHFYTQLEDLEAKVLCGIHYQLRFRRKILRHCYLLHHNHMWTKHKHEPRTMLLYCLPVINNAACAVLLLVETNNAQPMLIGAHWALKPLIVSALIGQHHGGNQTF